MYAMEGEAARQSCCCICPRAARIRQLALHKIQGVPVDAWHIGFADQVGLRTILAVLVPDQCAEPVEHRKMAGLDSLHYLKNGGTAPGRSLVDLDEKTWVEAEDTSYSHLAALGTTGVVEDSDHSRRAVVYRMGSVAHMRECQNESHTDYSVGLERTDIAGRVHLEVAAVVHIDHGMNFVVGDQGIAGLTDCSSLDQEDPSIAGFAGCNCRGWAVERLRGLESVQRC